MSVAAFGHAVSLINVEERNEKAPGEEKLAFGLRTKMHLYVSFRLAQVSSWSFDN